MSVSPPPSSPRRAAAVLAAEADLRPALAELLHSPPSRFPHAVQTIPPACHTLVQEAIHLQSTSSASSTPSPSDDHADARHLSRLARAIHPCIQYLNLLFQHLQSDHTPQLQSNIHRITAARHCATAISAFALLQSGAFTTELSSALFAFIRFGMSDHVSNQWKDATIQTIPAIIPALHVLVELPQSEITDQAADAVPFLVQVTHAFVRQMTTSSNPHLQDLIEIIISVIAFATCSRDTFSVPEKTRDSMARLKESVLVVAGPHAQLTTDIDTLLARWNTKPP